MDNAAIDRAKEHFGKLLEVQMKRMEKIKSAPDWIDYGKLKPIRIGILGGDGIGPFIAAESKRVLEFVLKDEVKSGKVEITDIEGLTIENRAASNKRHPGRRPGRDQEVPRHPQGPDDDAAQGRSLAEHRELQRRHAEGARPLRQRPPVRVPKQGIDWIFFRENTEDLVRPRVHTGIDVDDGHRHRFPARHRAGLRPHLPAGLRARQEERPDARHLRHQGQRRQDDRRPLPRELLPHRQGIPRHRGRRLVHRHHDGQARRREAPPRLPGHGPAQPLRRHPDRRGRRVPGRRGHGRQRQHRQAATPCSRPSTAPRPAWSPRAAPSTPTRPA